MTALVSSNPVAVSVCLFDHIESSSVFLISDRNDLALIRGRPRHRFRRTEASTALPGSGRNSATGRPSTVTVSDSPLATRINTRSPLLRRSLIVTLAIQTCVSRVIQGRNRRGAQASIQTPVTDDAETRESLLYSGSHVIGVAPWDYL